MNLKINKAQKFIYSLSLFMLMFFCLSACSSEELDGETQEAIGNGTTYTFQLPSGWKSLSDYQSKFGTQAVFAAEDTRSKSSMCVLIFPKDQVEQADFAERTQKELAQQNGYQDVEGVYYKEFTIEEQPAYKFTFETQWEGAVVWGHFYCYFSEDSVIQFLYYSANDNRYEDRVKMIDTSVQTVKETAYDAAAAEAEQQEQQADQITFVTSDYEVEIIGLATIDGEEDQRLLVLRYQFTNLSDNAVASNIWQDQVTLTQQGKPLASTQLPADTPSYDISELWNAGQAAVAPTETGEGVALFSLAGTESVLMTLPEGSTSEQQQYGLTLPDSEGES